MMLNRLSRIDLILFLISLLIVFNGLDFPFYWDNVVQISVPANWYYETNFNYFYVPDELATGHQTFVGMLFAGVWKIFGRTLLVSHLLMLPFVFGFLYQLHKLLINLQIKVLSTRILILILILIDATVYQCNSRKAKFITNDCLCFIGSNKSQRNYFGRWNHGVSVFISVRQQNKI